jgi:hypothetical protein
MGHTLGKNQCMETKLIGMANRAGSIYRYSIYIDILSQYDNRYSDPGTYRLHVINVIYSSRIP